MEQTAAAAPEENFFVLSNLPPGRAQKRLALGVVLSLFVIFILAAGPLARIQTSRVAAFVPAYTTALVLSEGITAFLLFSQFAIFRTRALLVISSGYLFAALMAVVWFLMFPGVFAPEGLIGGIQGRAYIYLFWHAGFPVFAIIYALIKDADPNKRYWNGTARAGIVLSVIVTVVTVSVLAIFIAVQHSALPRVELDPLRLSPLWLYFAVPMVSLIIVALLVLWVRRRSILDLWLMVVMCAYMIEIWLSYFPLAVAYGFGWYASRIFGLFASSLVLWILLYEITTLYARLVLAVRAQRREREARLVTGDTIAASIAHEVKQPLTAMVALANAALRWLSGEKPNIDRARDTLGQIVKAGHHASEIITNVRGLFGKDIQKRVPTDVNKLIRTVLGLVYLDLRKHSVESQLTLGDQLPPVTGNAVQLQQVILNLVMNAIESMNSVEPRVLSIRSESAGHNNVRVSIEDTGSGIDPADLKQIFKPMFTTKTEGMGMGLAICQSIIESHQGKIWVTAGASRGSIFQFELPTSGTNH